MKNGRAIFFKNSIFIFSTATSFCGEKENEKKNPEHVILRQVLSRDNETGKEIFLLTNMFDADALEIAGIYKKRWEIVF